jgi:regulator of protease activity HflC (stomatin/prohibitin superfamily)
MQKKSNSDSSLNPINPTSPLRSEKKGQQSMEEAHLNGVALALCILFIVLSVGFAIYADEHNLTNGWTITASILLVLVGMVILYSLRIASQWEKAVVLRLGKFHGLRGPGIFWLMPLFDTVSIWVDQRVMVTPFSAEKTLTRDTVPVNVDAVLFWVVWDAEKAALEVENYQIAIAWAAQTALREVIGQMTLADILIGRAKMDADLQKIIDERTTPWGITVQSVEIRDVIIPQDLEDAMSRQAQAERERQSRIILGESEKQIADSFAQASEAYVDNPTALHLRAMNMLFEGLKQKGALVIVPSSAVDTMNLGGMTGMISLAQNAQESQANRKKAE